MTTSRTVITERMRKSPRTAAKGSPSTRKIVFVYAGASALAGYESVNWGEKVLHDGSTLHDRDSFIYGGALTLDVEFYVADRIALLANLRERCLWGGDTKKFHTQWGMGIKFIIN